MEAFEGRGLHRLVGPDRELLILAERLAVDAQRQIARHLELAIFHRSPVGRAAKHGLVGRNREFLVELHDLGRDRDDAIREHAVIRPHLSFALRQPDGLRREFDVIANAPAPAGMGIILRFRRAQTTP